ncbi:MAG: alpha/beta hydrolase-fold protein [Caulobacteraceae bacterium]
MGEATIRGSAKVGHPARVGRGAAGRDLALACSAFAAALILASGAAAQPATKLEATVSPQAAGGLVTGRLVVAVATQPAPEPRKAMGLNGPAIFGANVDRMAAGQWASVDASARAFPIADLGALPAGDYYVQAVLIRYDQVRRADGHVIWVPTHHDGHVPFFELAGDLYSDVQKVHLDPARGFDVKMTLAHVIPPPPPPVDTPWIKHVRIKSELLTRFWGTPTYLSAAVLLPRGYDDHPRAHYPAVYANSHSETPYSFSFTPPTAEEIADAKASNVQTGYDFQKTWLSDGYPRFVAIAPFESSPYFLEAYAVDSVNNGPYGQAITTELIPYLEKTFRLIPKPYARFVQGASTGGWETLALQLKYPDFFGGAWVYNPDPISFTHWQTADIYKDDNLFSVAYSPLLSVERPFRRSTDGTPSFTQRQLAQFEAVQGDHRRSGMQLAIWEATYGPVGADGYPVALFDDRTGKIDHGVADYMRAHGYDLTEYARDNWATLGPKLAGKLNFISGEMDNFYLNLGVYDFEAMVKAVAGPGYPIRFVYGRPEKGHNWHHKDFSAMIREMAEQAKRTAPAGEDTGQWNY